MYDTDADLANEPKGPAGPDGPFRTKHVRGKSNATKLTENQQKQAASMLGIFMYLSFCSKLAILLLFYSKESASRAHVGILYQVVHTLHGEKKPRAPKSVQSCEEAEEDEEGSQGDTEPENDVEKIRDIGKALFASDASTPTIPQKSPPRKKSTT